MVASVGYSASYLTSGLAFIAVIAVVALEGGPVAWVAAIVLAPFVWLAGIVFGEGTIPLQFVPIATTAAVLLFAVPASDLRIRNPIALLACLLIEVLLMVLVLANAQWVVNVLGLLWASFQFR